MAELIFAILDRIEAELSRCYWNKNQGEFNSPFKNSGETYSNNLFTVRAYSWNNDNGEANFDSDFLKCWWYKHSHRDLHYKINFDKNSDKSELQQLADFLNNCLKEIKQETFDILK